MRNIDYCSVKKEKIKICHIITKMVYGGASIGTLHLARDMDPDFFHSTIICGCQSRDEGNLLNSIKDKNFDVIVIPEIIRDINPIKDIITFIKLTHLMKMYKYDIVHVHGSRASIVGRLAAAFSRIPIILYTIHGWSLKAALSFTFLFRLIEKMLALITTKFLFQTKSDLNEAILYKIGKPEQYVLTGNGVDLKSFLKYDKAKAKLERKELNLINSKVVGTVGRISTQKNPIGFINIAQEVLKKRQDTTFIFVGGGEMLEETRDLVKKMNLEKHIILPGFRKNIPEIIANFDIFILPSRWEGMPRSLIEAMALGKPVIVHAINGIDEIINDGYNGYIIPIGSYDTFAEKINNLLNNPHAARTIGQSGKQTALNYDFEKVVNITGKIYLNLMLQERYI